MRRLVVSLFLLSAALAVTACTVYKERPARAFSEATGGEGLERVFWREIKARHWDEVERRLASNFVAITPEGQFGRATAMERLKQLQIEDYSLGDFQSELNGNTFVVAYTLTLRGSRNGQPLPQSPQRMLAVWQQQKSGWVEIAHTIVGPGSR
jgi:hypothetical protein